jgi:PBSX family phage terminase large subunit
LCAEKRQIELYGRQYDFVACQERFSCFIGGIGSGKSFAGAVKTLHACKRPGVIMVVAPTYRMLSDATMRSFFDVANGAVTEFNKSDFIAKVGKAEVLFRSADSPDRLRGVNASACWIDEAALCPAETWEIVIGRLREGGRAGSVWITSTPKGRNWLYALQPQLTMFRSATHDNPYLSPDFVSSLESAYSGRFAQQELEGEFVSFEGLVYEEFDRGLHIGISAGKWKYKFAAVDEGYTNPAVILVLGVDSDDRLHIVEEFYQRRVLQGDVVGEAKRLQKEHSLTTFVVDPSAAGLIAEMRSAGLKVTAANNSVMPGIQAVKARLAKQSDGRTRLTVAPSCVNVVAEVESYIWKEGRAGLKDEPEKTNDHAMDALRYGVMHLDYGQVRLDVKANPFYR